MVEAAGRGSVWRRWDPHIHAPGTLFNDQFAGEDSWEDYLTSIETSEPRIEAIGVTDYYGTETYRRGCHVNRTRSQRSSTWPSQAVAVAHAP